MTILNFAEIASYDREWKYYFLMHTMTETAHAKKADFMKLFNLQSGQDKNVEVKVSINNVEVDYLEFITYMEKFFNEAVENKAKLIIKEKFGDLMDNLMDKMYSLKSNIEEIVDSTLPDYKRHE